MKNKKRLIAILLLAALALTGCTSGGTPTPTATVITQGSLLTVTDAPFTVGDGLPDGYDPTSEEDDGSSYVPGTAYNAQGAAVYAGATPIALDPLDMPTATPRPELTFTYTTYTSSTAGVSFEAPAGWEVTETAGTITLTEPANQQKDDYTAVITLSVTPVASNYTLSNVRTALSEQLTAIGSINYTSWSIAVSAKRTLLGKDGYYNDYRGELYGGTIVRGRVHMALVDSKLYTLHLTVPGWYFTSYMNIYTRIRNSLKTI